MIRELTIEDYEEVKNLVYQVHELHLENRPDIYNDANPCPMGYYERVISDSESIKYAYVFDDKILGIVMGEKQESKSLPILKSRVIYFIDDIVVDKNSRHEGIGRKLYNYVLEKGKSNGADAIELNVWAFNKNAIEFYKSLGMQEKNIKYEQKLK